MKRPLLAAMTGLTGGILLVFALGLKPGLILIVCLFTFTGFTVKGCLKHVRPGDREGKKAVFRIWMIISSFCLLGALACGMVNRPRGIERRLYGDRIRESFLEKYLTGVEETLSEEIFIRQDREDDPRKYMIMADGLGGRLSGTVENIKNVDGHLKITLMRRAVFVLLSDENAGAKDRSFFLAGRCLVSGISEEAPELSGTAIREGDRLTVTGSLKPLTGVTNPGQYDTEIHQLSLGVRTTFAAKKVTGLERPVFSVRRIAGRVREMIAAGYEKAYSAEEQALLRAMVLGDKTDLTTEERTLYEESGASHLLSLSGLHVSIAAGRVFRFLRRRKRSYGLSCLAGFFFLVFYGLVVAGGNSFLRAAIMFTTFLISEYLGADYDLISSMSLAVILMFLPSPWRAVETGCIVSFLSVLTIGTVLPFADKMYPPEVGEPGEANKKISLRHRFGKALLSGILFAMALGPVLMNLYYEWTPWSVLINLLIIPAMVPLMISALCGGMFLLAAGLLTAFASYAGPVRILAGGFFLTGKCVCLPGVLILKAFHILFREVGRLPLSPWVTGHRGIAGVLLLYCLEASLLGLCFCLRRMIRRKPVTPFLPSIGTSQASVPVISGAGGSPGGKKGRPSGLLTGQSCLCFLVSLCLLMVLLVPDPGLRITMLDVGQGDGILVQCPRGVRILIDCGSSSQEDTYRYTLTPALKYYGCGRLDYLVVTHPDQDHISGITDLLEDDFPVGWLVLPGLAGIGEDENVQELVKLAKKRGIPCLYMKRGDHMDFGEVGITCLHPPARQAGEDRNAWSLTLYLTYRSFDGLFTGDIGADQEEEILDWLRAGRKNGEFAGLADGLTFLKCAHHGSSGSSSEDFLQTIRPDVVGISAGRNNRYGHPGQKALDRMEEAGVRKVFCTSWGGAIEIRTDGERMQMEYH